MFHLSKMKFLVPSALLAILMGPAAAVAAVLGQSDGSPMRVVRFADLDLTRSEGAAALYSRISAAAWKVCELQTPQLYMRSQTYECRHLAIAKAITDVGSAALTKYYRTKTTHEIGESQQR